MTAREVLDGIRGRVAVLRLKSRAIRAILQNKPVAFSLRIENGTLRITPGAVVAYCMFIGSPVALELKEDPQ